MEKPEYNIWGRIMLPAINIEKAALKQIGKTKLVGKKIVRECRTLAANVPKYKALANN
ncbi:MAG: hypothetical protein IPO24_18755 [Bacteroidetes bacterium]|nr:hypothetical protein [Bacteroidota bacterium]